jgi:hypothetical protein
VEGLCEYGNELLAAIKFGEFVDWLMSISSPKDVTSVGLVNDCLNKIHYLQEKLQLHELNNNRT